MTPPRDLGAAETHRTRQNARATELVDAAAVAEYLSVARSWVYEHASELGARRLGAGPRARLRFSLAEVDERLTSCTTGRKSQHAAEPIAKPIRHRQRPPRLGTGVALLPIRGSTRAA